MAFKNFNRNLSFADLELVGVLEKNRTQGFLEEINRIVDWAPNRGSYSIRISRRAIHLGQ